MIYFCVFKTFFKQWLKNWGITPIQSEQKKIISKRVSYLNNYFKNLLCKEKELMQLPCDKFIHVFVYCFLCCAYWELLLHWTSSIIVDLSLSHPIFRESTQTDYSSYTCRTHSDIWPLRIIISGWLWNTCDVNQRDSSSSLH